MFIKRLLSTMKRTLANRPCTIAVEGNIGSGKTTFLKHMEKLGNVTIVAEPLDKWRDCKGHNLLDLMYMDPKRNSFTFQSYVQLTLLEAHSIKTPHPFKMLERSIYSARYCFVEKLKRDSLLSSPEFSVIDEWFKWIKKEQDVGIDMFVYLRTDPEVVYERIIKRDRAEERQVPFEYIRSLHEIHEDWLLNKTLYECPAPVFVLDGNVDLGEIGHEYGKFEVQVLNKKVAMGV